MTPPQALIFDLMGTCTNWHPGIASAISATPSLSHVSAQESAQLAADWRAGFFTEIHERFRTGAGTESIDVTHRRVLDRLLDERGLGGDIGEEERGELVEAWHTQGAWSDAVEAIERLKERFMVIVLANGTPRLQLDLVRSSELSFHALFSSQLLGLTKPDPAIYRKALELLQIAPEEAVMVAAHAYDLRAAKRVGMRTVYIRRETEDLDEDMDVVREGVDVFLEEGEGKGGPLKQLADLFCV
ncbi:haloacid dehalogenase [Aspergillus heteromorphus CBS 117.55]|uniref:Haloacid dehalogenase n=1 Tax=Aspergillus heteromorphus CBS 117.55 TaxID=1448321 RepID=A0A317X1X0_9EURO|nr:haloacid dehalogenase [Aspergillus heteromorphus CBS 117.55]PWY92566.1 haloacid dehalogenase [Aspergillus heteromorphus CBS 117.55]